MEQLLPEKVQENPWIQALVVLAVFLCSIWFVYWIRDVLLPFLLAFIVAYILDPVVNWVDERLPFGRMTAIISLGLVFLLLTMGFTVFVADQTLEFAETLGKLVENPPDLLGKVRGLLPAAWGEQASLYLDNLKPQQLLEQSLELLRRHSSTIGDTLSQGSIYFWAFASQTFGVLGVAVNVIVFVFVTLYLLRDFSEFIASARDLVPAYARSGVDEVFQEIDELMRAFLRGHLIVCVIIGVLYGSGYALVGLDGGFLVGILSGLLNVVPYVGPAIGFGAALLMAFYQFGLSWWLLGVFAVYSVVQFLEGNLITPKIVGEAVGLHPIVVIFALMVFGKLLGFIGLLLAIPLAAILKVLFERLIDEYKKSEYYLGPA